MEALLSGDLCNIGIRLWSARHAGLQRMRNSDWDVGSRMGAADDAACGGADTYDDAGGDDYGGAEPWDGDDGPCAVSPAREAGARLSPCHHVPVPAVATRVWRVG